MKASGRINGNALAPVKPDESVNDLEKNWNLMQDKKASDQKRLVAFEKVLETKLNSIAQCIPEGCGLTPHRMLRLVLGSFRINPKLLNCDPASIFLAVNDAATLGLQLDSTLGHAYLIPYGNECKLMPGYKGLVDLARRKDKIAIKTRCVYKGDEFRYEEGDEDFIRHVPDQSADADNDDENVTHVYLIARDLETGSIICRNVWTKKRIEKHKRKYSKAWEKKDNPWNTAWGSMARKTLIRDSICRGEIPVSVEIQKLASQEEQHEARFLEAPQPERQSITSLNGMFSGRDSGPIETTFDAPVSGEESQDDIPFGDEFSGELDDQSQEVAEKRRSSAPVAEDVVTTDEESSREGASESAESEYHIRTGESPKQWEERITASLKEIEKSEGAAEDEAEMEEIWQAVEAAVEAKHAHPAMFERLFGIAAKICKKFGWK